MRSVSIFAVALAAGAAAMIAMPADAQKRGKKAAYAGPSLSKEERTALAALETALAARDYAGANAALTSARSAARGSDARYYLSGLQLRLGRETNNQALQSAAIDALIASGRVTGAELGQLYAAQGALASFAGERRRADGAFMRAMELAPTPDTALALAQLKIDNRKDAEAVPLIERAIALRAATGQPVPESWYRRGITVATIAKLAPQALKLSREWVAAYPSPQNWRDAVLLYRDYAKPDQAGLLDATRLMRLTKGLAGERDYFEAAAAFSSANLPGESRSVFEEGVSGRMVDPAKATFKEAIAASAKNATAARAKLAALRTAAGAAATGAPALDAGDQHLSFGDYAAAADLYRAAATKGGVDPAVASTRLGISLALAGRRAEAEAAFRAVAGPRAELASLWLVWLGQRA
jgi:hypothetical protein